VSAQAAVSGCRTRCFHLCFRAVFPERLVSTWEHRDWLLAQDREAMRLPSRPAGQGRAPPGISTIPRPVCSQRRAGRPSFQSIPMMQRKTRARYHYPSAESSRRRRSRSAARLTAIAAAAHYSRTPGPSFPCDKCNPSATGIARRHLSASRVGCLFPCVRGSPIKFEAARRSGSSRTYCRRWAACTRCCRRGPLAFPKAPQPSSVGHGRSKSGFLVLSQARVRPLT